MVGASTTWDYVNGGSSCRSSSIVRRVAQANFPIKGAWQACADGRSEAQLGDFKNIEGLGVKPRILVANSPLCPPWLGKRRREKPRTSSPQSWGMARMGNKSIRHAKLRKVPHLRWSASVVLALAIGALTPTAGYAWTSVGEYRDFPANLILPQVTSTDGFWFTPMTQPFQGVAPMMGMAPTSRRDDPPELVSLNLQQNDHPRAWHPVE